MKKRKKQIRRKKNDSVLKIRIKVERVHTKSEVRSEDCNKKNCTDCTSTAGCLLHYTHFYPHICSFSKWHQLHQPTNKLTHPHTQTVDHKYTNMHLPYHMSPVFYPCRLCKWKHGAKLQQQRTSRCKWWSFGNQQLPFPRPQRRPQNWSVEWHRTSLRWPAASLRRPKRNQVRKQRRFTIHFSVCVSVWSSYPARRREISLTWPWRTWAQGCTGREAHVWQSRRGRERRATDWQRCCR